MLGKLRNVLFGRRQRERNANPQATCKQGEATPADDEEMSYLLLTRRVSDPIETIPGFREVYYCPTCHDYFVLAWHLRSSAFAEECDVVEETRSSPGEKGFVPGSVFCPKCKSDYAMYGFIQHPVVALDPPEGARIYESLDYPFPPEVSSHLKGRITIGSLLVEKIILLVTGQFPEGLDVRGFAYSGFKEIVLSRHGGEFLISEQGGIRLHLIRVNTIVDETAWLTPLLESEVYEERSAQPRVFLTYGLVKLRAPLGQALFCLVLSDD